MEEKTINFNALDELLNKVNLDKVDSEYSGSQKELPDGYYLSDLKEGELGVSKSSGNIQVHLKLQTTEDGFELTTNGNGETVKVEIPSTTNKYINLYYPLTNEEQIKRFAADMMKFQDEEGNEIIEKEYFTNSKTIQQALEILVDLPIYVHVSTSTNKKGESSTWKNLTSWKRMEDLLEDIE